MDRDDGNVQRECGTVAAHWPAPLGFHRPGCATIGSGLQPTQAWRSLPAARDAARAGQGPSGYAVSPAAGCCVAVDLATVAESAAVAAAACRAAGRRGQGVQVSLLRTSRTGYRVAWDTVSHGIPRRMGYRAIARDTAAWDTRRMG
jgi:hypothetical protein